MTEARLHTINHVRKHWQWDGHSGHTSWLWHEIWENVNIGSDNLIWTPWVHSEQHVVH